MDRPCAFHVHPVRVQIGVRLLVTELLEILWRLMVHQAAASPPPSPFLVSCAQLLLGDLDTVGRRGVHPLGEGDAATLEDCGRHFGGVGGVLWGRWWSITRPEGKNGGLWWLPQRRRRGGVYVVGNGSSGLVCNCPPEVGGGGGEGSKGQTIRGVEVFVRRGRVAAAGWAVTAGGDGAAVARLWAEEEW